MPRECVVSMRDCVRSARGEPGTALGTGQRVKASCVWRGLAQACESTNQRQSQKGPGAHLVHLTDAQTGDVPCPDNTASSGRAGNQAPRQTLWRARGSCHSTRPPPHPVPCSPHLPHRPSTERRKCPPEHFPVTPESREPWPSLTVWPWAGPRTSLSLNSSTLSPLS